MFDCRYRASYCFVGEIMQFWWLPFTREINSLSAVFLLFGVWVLLRDGPCSSLTLQFWYWSKEGPFWNRPPKCSLEPHAGLCPTGHRSEPHAQATDFPLLFYLTVWFWVRRKMSNYLLGRIRRPTRSWEKSGKFLSEVPAILFPEQPALETYLRFGSARKILMRIVSAEANRRAWALIKQSGTWASLQKLNNWFVFFPWFKWLWRGLTVHFGSTLC